MRSSHLKSLLIGSVCFASLFSAANAGCFKIGAGDLESALDTYASQTGANLVVSYSEIKGVHTNGVFGAFSNDAALSKILAGTGFSVRRDASGVVAIVHDRSSDTTISPLTLAQAAPVARSAVETVTVTSSKLGGADVQTVPIAITALSQEQLTAQQIAGGPDLVKSIPNLTFSKTNFTGYNIQIRGIGTQAISVTTDPAVAVAFNDTPFLRNHFFEQEFYDVAQVEVLRGPQGTLYGRNATAGVVNVVSAKPSDQFEAMASGEFGNYKSRRFEGMLNLPLVDDRLDLRVAGEWTKRDGYAFNETTNQRIDGRDLWSGRASLRFRPNEDLDANLVWEHFSEGDDRMRSTKQLCKKDSGPTSIGNVLNLDFSSRAFLSQGCLPVSLYSPEAYETPNGSTIPFVFAGQFIFKAQEGTGGNKFILASIDPYASTTQSTNLRVIQSELTPTYKAKNDTIELNADYKVVPFLTLTSQTGFNHDSLRSTEDYNRFNTTPGIFFDPDCDSEACYAGHYTPGGIWCDPQLGCSSRIVGEDISQARSWQMSQEFRIESSFAGPFNFSLGGNYLHYETLEDYYVFYNVIGLEAAVLSGSTPGDFSGCFPQGFPGAHCQHYYGDPTFAAPGNIYVDPNPIDNLNGNGHNYFRSINPYLLNSYAGFGEVYYQVAPDLKLTGGLRWTDDHKHFTDYPSWALENGWGYPPTDVVDQEWREFTGRFVANWTPKLDFTDQTMVYASFSRGYKGGGANPPGPVVDVYGHSASVLTHPLTFKPEFINAFELGSKNTALDGALTLNADVFYYDYKNYQISQIVDRTSINLNFNAKVKGAEIESNWEPIPGLRFNLAGGYETSRVDNNQLAIDLMDRTAGHSDWVVIKPTYTATSNCILPRAVVESILHQSRALFGGDDSTPAPPAQLSAGDINFFNVQMCQNAYTAGGDPGGFFFPTGFDPSTAPNNGAGFAKDLGGNELPNTPHWTLSLGAQYSMPLTEEWAGTLRGDFYYQTSSWARIYNDDPYDQLRSYKNFNVSLILTNQDGWQAMAFVKNVFNTTAITGAFLNSDDSALTTNVFVTDPRLLGIRITKNW